MKQFADLSEHEILALAISNEDEDSRIYREFARGLAEQFPASAAVLSGMADEENRHRDLLLDLFRTRFGDHLPLIRRQDVKGFISRKPLWLIRPLQVDAVRDYAASMESDASRFYHKAAEASRDPSVRALLLKLAAEEDRHEALADRLTEKYLTPAARDREAESARRAFVLQYVQPGLVGLAASVGAGISMGFAEALSDDGTLSGRGSPWIRGLVCGLMTTLGGLGHTLPYLIPDFMVATIVAVIVVAVELALISWIRHRFMDTPWLQATFQIAVGGTLVFLAGILIGSA